MSKNILKDAAFEAMKRELRQIPSEEQLAPQYPLSQQLTEKIQLIINEYNYKYKIMPKKRISAAVLLVITVLFIWRYNNDVYDRNLLQNFIRITLLSLIAILFPRQKKRPAQERRFRNLTGQYQPALMDVEDPLGRYGEYDAYGYEFDYTMPEVPAGFIVRDEARMAARHKAVFDNGRGIIINYEKISFNNGIPYTIDTAKISYESLVINENDAIRFVLDGINHLIWEDFSCQYHLYGNAGMQLMQQIAESLR